ncbi:sigma-54 interaction domain-containing protein [Ureibacillus sp. NPDC094379]
MQELINNLSASVITQILETAFQWFVVVDQDANIIYINNEYCQFLEVNREDAVGKHVTDVIENTEMHEILETGRTDIAAPQYIKGTYMLANRVPLIVDGQIVGAFGSVIFRDMSDWKKLSSHVRITIEQIEATLKHFPESFYSLCDIKGSSNAIKKIKETIAMIAPTKLPVLIEGEIGTGKEMIAQSIHGLSDRLDHHFVKINCATIPKELLEEELFGKWDVIRNRWKKGRIQLAHRGTLFIEEISDLPLPLQAKLLKVIQEERVQPVDSDEEIPVDLRVIVSTNMALIDQVKAKLFREDLFYRIQAITIQIPPLRERIEDLPELVETFMSKVCAEAGRRHISIDGKILRLLQTYDWPGNVRELQNVLQAMVQLTNGDQISEEILPIYIRRQKTNYVPGNGTLEEILFEVEGQILQQQLNRETNKLKVAEKLGISRSTLYEKIKKHNL